MSDKKDIIEFKDDTKTLGNLTVDFIQGFYPSYSINNDIASFPKEDSLSLINSFAFYRICECKIYDVEDRFEYFLEKLKKLFTAAYSIKRNVCYGIVSKDGNVSLVLGVDSKNGEDETILSVIKGLLSGIKIEKYDKKIVNEKYKNGYAGCISGVPAIKIDGEYQKKDLSPLIRSLNGQNYTIMILCKPLDKINIQEKINKAIDIQDKCFAISKRTLSLQTGKSKGTTHTTSHGENESKSIGGGMSFGPLLALAGGLIAPGVGTAAGSLIGLIASLNFNISKSKGTNHSISDAISKTITENESISGDIQNGFAIELMKMAESMVERLKIGRNIGMWETLVSMMYNPNEDEIFNGLNFAYKEIDDKIDLNSISFIPSNKYKKEDYIKQCIYESIISLLVSGVFSNHKLPKDEFIKLINDIIKIPTDENLINLNEEFKSFYGREPKNKIVEIVAGLVSKEYSNNYNITQLINDFTLKNNNQFVEDVKNDLENKEKEVIK